VVAARRALDELERALAEDAAGARQVASGAQDAVWRFVETCFDVSAATSTPDDLPERVDAGLRDALGAFERQRFSPRPARPDVIAAGESARGFLRGLAGDAELA